MREEHELGSDQAAAGGRRAPSRAVGDASSPPHAAGVFEPARLLALLLDLLPEGVAVVDRDARLVTVNRALAEMMGRPAEELLGRRVRDVVSDGTALEGVVREVLANGRALLEVEIAGETSPASGEARQLCVSYFPVPGDDGAPHGVLALVGDVTERTRVAAARARVAAAQAFLADAGRVLSASLDTDATLRAAAELPVGHVGDFGIVHVVEGDGTLRQAAVAAVDPKHAERLEELGRGVRAELSAAVGIVAETLRSGRSRLVGDTAAVDAASWRHDTLLRHLWPAGEPGSLLVVPLVSAGGPHAALTVGTLAGPGSEHLDAADLALVEQLGARAALALENARLHQAERRARADAEAASQAKSGFLATMSHEIRTPINAIMGYTDLLAMGLSGPLNADQLERLGRIRASSRHLLGLVNEILDFAKVESGRVVVAREQASAAAAVEAAVTLVHPQAVARNILLANHCDLPALRYMGDPKRVEQILVNLLGNAVRFTPPGGRVAVSCALVEQPPPGAQLAAGALCVCALTVEDTGPGIPPEHLGTIFEPFVQVDSGLTRRHGGSGLGLAISRRLARLMGGDVTVRSRPGHGSAFTLWLPGVPMVADTPAEPRAACTIVERRDAARVALGLAEVGEALLGDVDALLRRYVRRLRATVPGAGPVTDTQLADHIGTLLADLAQSLMIVQSSSGAPTQLMRDGSEIQRVIADRHGRQRHALGWTAEELERDFEVLAREVERTVRRAAARAGRDPAHALSLLRLFLRRARGAGQLAFQRLEEQRGQPSATTGVLASPGTAARVGG